jgi:hypothetical protein
MLLNILVKLIKGKMEAAWKREVALLNNTSRLFGTFVYLTNRTSGHGIPEVPLLRSRDKGQCLYIGYFKVITKSQATVPSCIKLLILANFRC